MKQVNLINGVQSDGVDNFVNIQRLVHFTGNQRIDRQTLHKL